MALDRQRILGELGSVMKQLQSADCGCLGKLFGGPQQTTQPMGSPLPTCGGCRRACCCGHGYGQYNQPTPMGQTAQNMNPTQLDYVNNPQQPMSGNMYGMGPQIVNMMRGENYKPENTPARNQGPLTGPMVIDAPQSPHGKVGLTPFNPTATSQQGQFAPPSMNQAGATGHFTQPSSQANMPNMMPWTPQNTPAAHQMATPQSNPHGQHSQGIAKFNEMFPGVKQGLGGNLGFDPMAIAIQMNPNNHLQSAMDTMHKIMNNNRIMDNTPNNSAVAQPGYQMNSNVAANPPETNAMMQQQLAPDAMTQNRVIPVINEQMHNNYNIINRISPVSQEIANMEGQAKYQQPQQVYAATVEPSSVNQQRLPGGDTRQLPDQQQYQMQPQMQPNGQQQMIDLNAGVPNLPVEYDETAENVLAQPLPNEQDDYANQQRTQEIIKEPIFPADSSRNMIYAPSKMRRNYGYNTLGQPVEMLPAKMYHPLEPSLPQTLSPQPDSLKLRNNTPKAVKATISKISLTGNKPAGRNPSRSQLQHIYNQYKGSHSFTQQNVRQPGGGTYSDGRLKVPQTNVSKVSAVPVERVGGDTIVSNPPPNLVPIQKVEQVMGQIGDVPVAKPMEESPPVKEVPGQMKKCRNGLQDMVFSSYPTSTAWTFHGHGPKDHSLPAYRYRSRQY